MAYYLKKTKLKGRTYLSIDESFYSHDNKGTAHKCFKSLGFVETWKENSIEDPISHFQKEVDALNQEKVTAEVRKISDKFPNLYLGYFPFKVILDKLHIKKYLDYFKLTNDFKYNLYELLSSVVYARVVNPCNKHRTFHDVLPELYGSVNYSYDQLFRRIVLSGKRLRKIHRDIHRTDKQCFRLGCFQILF